MEPLINYLKKIYWSDPVKTVVASPWRVLLFAKQYLNRPVVSVDIQAKMGFFAVLQLVLYILLYCEEKGLSPDISAHGGQYGDSAGQVDWFKLYFKRVKPYGRAIENRIAERNRIFPAKLLNVQQLGLHRRYKGHVDFTQLGKLFNTYYSAVDSITEEVNQLCSELSVGPTTLGVHYRGTDKHFEAGRVSWSTIVECIRNTVAAEPKISHILLSSDEFEFLEHVKQQGLRCSITIAPSRYFGVGGKPVHFSGHNGLEIGREALVTALLLSRCGWLLKTASFLSAWSKIFRPELPVLLISPPGVKPSLFPDTALWTAQRNKNTELCSVRAFNWYHLRASEEAV